MAFHLNVLLTVRDPDDVDNVTDALDRAGAESRLEDGCERWEAYRFEDDACRFLLVERWASEDHWSRHRQGHAVTEIYMKEVLPLADREAHPSRLIGS